MKLYICPNLRTLIKTMLQNEKLTKKQNLKFQVLFLFFQPLHRGAFCQFPFWWIYYFHSSKSTGKETGKTHLCALKGLVFGPWQSLFPAKNSFGQTWGTFIQKFHVRPIYGLPLKCRYRDWVYGTFFSTHGFFANFMAARHHACSSEGPKIDLLLSLRSNFSIKLTASLDSVLSPLQAEIISTIMWPFGKTE